MQVRLQLTEGVQQALHLSGGEPGDILDRGQFMDAPLDTGVDRGTKKGTQVEEEHLLPSSSVDFKRFCS